MSDLTEHLASFAAERRVWQQQRSLQAGQQISAWLEADLDWDEGAGEQWIRVREGERVVALIALTGPLIFIRKELIDSIEVDDAFDLIPVPEMDAHVFDADPATLRLAFGDRAFSSPALDPRSFSAEELWFASV